MKPSVCLPVHGLVEIGSSMRGHQVFSLSEWIRLFWCRLRECLIVIKHRVTVAPLRCGHTEKNKEQVRFSRSNKRKKVTRTHLNQSWEPCVLDDFRADIMKKFLDLLLLLSGSQGM